MRLAFRILDLAARLLMALGVGCLLLGGYLAWMTLSFSRDAVHTTGEVVSYLETQDGKFRPRIRFRTENGSIVTTSSQLATGSKRFEAGARVPLVYQPAKPTEARIALFTDNWLGACIAAIIGAVGIAGGVLMRRSLRRELERLPVGPG